MHRLIHILGLVSGLMLPWSGSITSLAAAQQAPGSPLIVPAGITVQLATMRPVWTQTDKTGDLLSTPTQPPTVTDPYAHAGPTTKELVAFTVGPVAFLATLLAIGHLARPHGDYVIEAAGWQFQLTLQSPLPVDIAHVNAAATPAP